MESYEQGYEADRFEYPVSQNYHCPICLNVFKDPVMCQRNEHFFCRPCVTRHLTNSQTCPSCINEELTLETLNQAPRFVRGCLSELNIRCDYFNRGCRDLVQLGDLESHVKDCGFTPVVCSNEGCLVEINKRDRIHHETEACEFRKVQCPNCAEIAKEMDEVKMKLTAVNDKLDEIDEVRMKLTAVNDRLEEMGDVKKSLATAQNEMGKLKMNSMAVNDKLDGVEIKLAKVNNDMAEIKMNLVEIKEQLTTLPDQTLRGIQTEREKMMKRIEEVKTDGRSTKSSVVIAGGYAELDNLNSVEAFSCSKKSWTPLQSMKERRDEASAVIYKDQIIVSGGGTGHGLTVTDSMESLAINPTIESAQWSHFPAKLPSKLQGHSSVVYNGRLIVIGGNDGMKYTDSIHEVSLDPPYTSKFLTRMPETKAHAGVELFNDIILIVGGKESTRSKDSVDSVIMYDINKNEYKQLASLPFAVSKMATVRWGDNVIVMGGVDKDGTELNTVVIYNVQTGKSHMLPAMKHKRQACAAVVTGNAIVVMGGRDERRISLKSAESFSFDRYSWEELPSMNEARAWPTAVAC